MTDQDLGTAKTEPAPPPSEHVCVACGCHAKEPFAGYCPSSSRSTLRGGGDTNHRWSR